MSTPDKTLLKGKTALITGASSGIGRVTAHALAEQGATVVLLCRNSQKGARTRKDIIEKTGNTSVDLLVADLGSFWLVRKAADEFLKRHNALHLLINNAGVLMCNRRLTEDRLETTFAVNHLGHFLLTGLLLDRLRASAPGRIINVSSKMHTWSRINFDNLDGEKGYSQVRAYAQSKLANVLFTYKLAEMLRRSKVSVNCLHPGFVATSFGAQGVWWYRMMKPLLRPFQITPEKAAESLMYLATSEEVSRLTGKYFVKNQPVASSKISYDREIQDRLWEVSSLLTGMDPKV